MAYDLSSVDREIGHLKRFIRKLGSQNDEGQYVVTFGVLFDDDEAANTFEAIVGTLKAARKRGVIDFKGQILLKGPHDAVPITLLMGNDETDDEPIAEMTYTMAPTTPSDVRSASPAPSISNPASPAAAPVGAVVEDGDVEKKEEKAKEDGDVEKKEEKA